MKKIMYAVVNIIFILSIMKNVVTVFANDPYTYSEDDNYIYFENSPVYFILGTDFEKFFDEPSLEKLESVCFKKYSSAQYNKETDYITFHLEKVESGVGKYELDSGTEMYDASNSVIPVSPQKISMLEKNNINLLLKKNGIYSDVKSVSLIITEWGNETYPYIVWINTNDANNYYLTSDYLYSYEKNSNWVLEVFNTNWNDAKPISQEGFEDMYLWQEGQLYINEKKVEDKAMPIFERYVVRIPFRTLLEEWGFKDITWDKENQALLAVSEKDNINYAILLPDKNRVEDVVSIYPDDIVQLEYCGMVYFRNNRFYVTAHDYIEFLYENLNIDRYSYEYDFDFKNRIVKIGSVSTGVVDKN